MRRHLTDVFHMPEERGDRPSPGTGERGQAMLALLVAAVLVTVIGVSLVSLMNTDMSHAFVQYAVSRSFYIAQAGLQEATAHVFAAADPAIDATPAEGVTAPYGGGHFTYWVDAGPATGCEAGLKTLEALGETAALGRKITARVQACAAPGVPFLSALFGVAPVEFQGASQTYLAPYEAGTPGGGGNLGSFTEINFAGNDVRLNAVSEDETRTVTLRDGTFSDYALFGFPTRPDYNPTPTDDPDPWILGVYGDLIKAQPPAGPVPNPCGTPYACVTVGNNITDVPGVADLREARDLQHVYVRRIRKETVPPLALDPTVFQAQAEQNTANAALNEHAGFRGKSDSHYQLGQLYAILYIYLPHHPSEHLQGTIYVDGSFVVSQDMDLGGPSGNVTLAVGDDLILLSSHTLTNTHDLTTVSGRRTPGILVFGSPTVHQFRTQVCGGPYVNGSGRLVMCPGSRLVVDGLVYTQDGMTIAPQASVDQVGAMYHNTRGTSSPSFSTQDARVVLRFDPLALSAFGKGAAILSWQQVH
jgi:hypothetical protein